MRKDSTTNGKDPKTAFSKSVATSEARKLRTNREGPRDIWLGLGMFGLIGWSVAIPAILGAVLGAFLDRHEPSAHSWTLTCLIAGLFLGCLNAWHWVAKEEKAMREEQEDNDE